MESKSSILFYGKRTRPNGQVMTIYMRVTINGKRFEVTANRQIEPARWSASANKAKGNSEEARGINAYLDVMKQKVYSYEKEILKCDQQFTVEALKQKWAGIQEKPRMLIEIFKNHNEEMKALIGKDFAKGTLTRYKTSLDHTRSFLKWKYKADDIDIKKLDFEFITSYEFWLKTIRNCNHNTAMKYLSNFKKIINRCIRNSWLSKNPFFGFKMTKKEVERKPLTMEEIQAVLRKHFECERLNQVRDIFIFCCYTGLAYADIKKLKRSEIAMGIDGEKWIFTHREKTGTSSRIPLLPMAIEVMSKYNDHPKCISNDLVLPVLSNQKMNSYLHEIADVTGIKKELTFHIARHTFATTITLTNGVPIETVSKMLGHKSLRTTQIYAKIIDKKISEDMGRLREKLQ